MRSIDIHAHLVPASLWRAAEAGREWHGFRHEPGEGLGTILGTNGKRIGFTSPKVRLTPEERLADMDAQGVDMQVISIHTPLFGYHLDTAQGLATNEQSMIGVDPGIAQDSMGVWRLRPDSPLIDSCDAAAFVRVDSDYELDGRGYDHPLRPNVLGAYDRGADELRPLFADGFESGTTNAWQEVVP